MFRVGAREGENMYSDNATNFIGAKREIDETHKFLRNEGHMSQITNTLTEQGINWHFIPARSPHWGGLWESAVKSFKHHVIRVIGNTLLTFDTFLTYVIEIEGILNSRPLTPLSSDPNDLKVLTPGHFLIGDSLTNVPEGDLRAIPTARLSSWQQVQQMKQHFWTRWSKEYLHELTVRKKWHVGNTKEVKIGSVVLLNEDNIFPMQWKLGRIIEAYPGQDGVIRVVMVQTVSGRYKRSIKKLSPLPFIDNQNE